MATTKTKPANKAGKKTQVQSTKGKAGSSCSSMKPASKPQKKHGSGCC